MSLKVEAESKGVFGRGLFTAMINLDDLTIKLILDAFPDCLDQRAKQVIELRYGLNGNPEKTLQQIGDMFGVCRERVRQIERDAIRKLKHPSRLKKINMVKSETE